MASVTVIVRVRAILSSQVCSVVGLFCGFFKALRQRERDCVCMRHQLIHGQSFCFVVFKTETLKGSVSKTAKLCFPLVQAVVFVCINGLALYSFFEIMFQLQELYFELWPI